MSAPDLDAAARELMVQTIAGTGEDPFTRSKRRTWQGYWDNGVLDEDARAEWRERAALIIDAANHTPTTAPEATA